MHALGYASMAEVTAQLIRSALYLLSNKVATSDSTNKFMSWILRQGVDQVIETILAFNLPTTKVLITNMLVSAATTGSVETTRKLLARDVEVNEVVDSTTALYQAIKNGHLMVSRLLLNAGAHLNLRSESLICLAAEAYRNRAQLVELLIETGADLSVCGTHVLVTAVEKQDLTLIKTLLRAGVSVNGLDLFPCISALQRLAGTPQAVFGEDCARVAQVLLEAGANINAPVGLELEEVFASLLRTEDDTVIIPKNGFLSLDCLATPIQLAAREGDMELVQLFIDKGADVNACPWEGIQFEIPREGFWPDSVYERTVNNGLPLMTALQWAVRNGDMTMLRTMLQKGAHVDERGPSGFTPLQMAGSYGSTDMIKLLISYGADINASKNPSTGLTVLQAAASEGSVETVQLCLAFGANPNAPPSSWRGRTALQAAAGTANTDLVCLLLEAGSEVNAEAASKNGRTSLQAAVEVGHLQTVQILLSWDADVNAPASSLLGGLTALQAALVNIEAFAKACPAGQEQLSDLEILKAILEAGPDVNAPASPQNGITALEAAIQSGRVDIVNTLLHMGASPNDHLGRIPGIIRTVAINSIELVGLLISNGADLEVRCDGSVYPTGDYSIESVHTALHKAIQDGNLPMTTFLLDSGARINSSLCSDRWTPLQAAAALGYLDLVDLLLARCADPNTGNRESALQLALSINYVGKTAWSFDAKITSALIAAHAEVNTNSRSSPLRLAAGSGHIEVVQELLAAGANVNVVDEDGATPLQASIMTGSTSIAKELIQAGADVNTLAGSFRHRQTALQAAAERGNLDIVRYLLDRGANVNAPANGKYGVTALQASVIAGYLNISIVLLEAGAQIDAPTAMNTFYKGRSALELAAEYGRLDCAHLLLSNYPQDADIRKVCDDAAKRAVSEGHMVLAKSLSQHGIQRSQERTNRTHNQ